MKRVFLLLVVGLLGCSTDAISPNNAHYANPERIYKYQDNIDVYTSKLIVVRDSGITGGACYAAVYIDGEKVASLKPEEKVELNLNSGEKAVGASFEGSGLCSFGNDRQERYINLKENERKAVRIYTDGQGNMDIRPTTL